MRAERDSRSGTSCCGCAYDGSTLQSRRHDALHRSRRFHRGAAASPRAGASREFAAESFRRGPAEPLAASRRIHARESRSRPTPVWHYRVTAGQCANPPPHTESTSQTPHRSALREPANRRLRLLASGQPAWVARRFAHVRSTNDDMDARKSQGSAFGSANLIKIFESKSERVGAGPRWEGQIVRNGQVRSDEARAISPVCGDPPSVVSVVSSQSLRWSPVRRNSGWGRRDRQARGPTEIRPHRSRRHHRARASS